MRHTVLPAAAALQGAVRVPGDKSISHRAVLFAGMAFGCSRLTGVLDSADVRSTIEALRALGARVETAPGDGGLDVTVEGWHERGPASPDAPVDCGNSGTTARLLLGALAGWPCEVTLVGDASLSKRPMRRVAEPLARMGAAIELSAGGTLPARMRGTRLAGVEHELPVASAQVKTALLLAGLRARGRTLVAEPAPSRDHTERLLPAFGVPVGRDGAGRAWVDGPVPLHACDLPIPGDPSSAAFLLAAAALVPGSDVILPDVALNPTRTGFLRVLERMGARVSETPAPGPATEPVGALRVRGGSALRAVTVSAAEVPSLIDEIPVLAVVATAAEGTTRFEGVGELRVKESDRLAALTEALTALGATVRAGADTLEVDGPCRLHGAALDSLGDHRLAMAYAVAGLAAESGVAIDRFEAIDVSYPGFLDALRALGAC